MCICSLYVEGRALSMSEWLVWNHLVSLSSQRHACIESSIVQRRPRRDNQTPTDLYHLKISRDE